MVGWFSRLVVATTVRMPKWFVRWVSRRYVAGSHLDDAISVMKRLSAEGACFTIDVLGEEITSLDEANFFLEEYIRVMKAIEEHQFDANISIKPAFGLLVDPKKGYENIRTLVAMAAEHDMFVRLDMEDHRVTTATIDIVRSLHNEGLTNVGTVLQGRLFQTLADIDAMETDLGGFADYRICKGIYLEPEDLSFTGYREIVDATNAAIDKMFAAGAYVGVATHDTPVIDYTLSALKSYGMGQRRGRPSNQCRSSSKTQGPGIRISNAVGRPRTFA